MSPSLSRQPSPEEERISELEAENAELRKQNEILATTRRLEEQARRDAEAGLAESNEMYKAAMALWTTETGVRKQAEAELAAERSFIEFCLAERMYPIKRAREIWAEAGTS